MRSGGTLLANFRGKTRPVAVVRATTAPQLKTQGLTRASDANQPSDPWPDTWLFALHKVRNEITSASQDAHLERVKS